MNGQDRENMCREELDDLSKSGPLKKGRECGQEYSCKGSLKPNTTRTLSNKGMTSSNLQATSNTREEDEAPDIIADTDRTK